MFNNKEKVQVDWQQQVQQGGKQGIALVLALLAVLLMLALVTYHPEDPGWRQSFSEQDIHNWGGRIGAFVSDLLFSMFGYVAYILAVLPLATPFQRKKVYIKYSVLGWVWRLTGLFILMLAGSVLSFVYDESQLLPAGAGGILGQSIAEPLVINFGLVGGTLISFAVFLFGLSIWAHLSWVATVDDLGGWVLKGLNAIRERAKRKKSTKNIHQPTSSFATNKQEPVLLDVPTLTAQPDKPVAATKTEKSAESVMKSVTKKAATAVAEQKKALKIEPFKKKSKGTGAQGTLFELDALPPLKLLNRQEGEQEYGYTEQQLEDMSRLLERKLHDFGVKAEVVSVSPGPVITRFEIQPAPGVKASKISNLAKDLARSLAMISVRVVEVIPGKSVMGLEVPNENRAMVFLGDVIASKEYQSNKSPLSMALGHDIAGDPVTADLAKMPHLLVAGTTGSGKSVGVNSMLISMLYKASPDDVRMIMVDPKMLELSVYDGIPHLLTPVITDMKEAANGLRWCVGEMERRYKLMASLGVRNIAGYNKKVLDAKERGEPLTDPLWKAEESFEEYPPELEKLPYIVVVIDEFADMMMIVGKKVEELIARIAQKARAAGIHLILATQRPSVDIITGLIKANVPTRMAFQVSSRIDSRTILDQGGAEQLLGHGDMLYLPPGTSLPIRVHGAFVDDHEVHAVVADWKARGEPDFIESITEGGDSSIVVPGFPAEGDDGETDALFDEAVAFVTQTRKVSISSVQRKLRIGYNRAARLVESMEQAGVVSEPSQNGAREVIAPPPVAH
ncbi:DNA translocase FtsK [Bermanella sp. R86510]|uniref:DNA translocase FtsK n=1 Tax=unclassified Bermanella TaxID=2627862 RepID=UPI0037CCA4F0